MPKCKDAIAVNRPTCVKDPNGTKKFLCLIIGVGEGRQSLRTDEGKGGKGREREGTGGGENLLSDNNVKFLGKV